MVTDNNAQLSRDCELKKNFWLYKAIIVLWDNIWLIGALHD